MTMHDAYMFPIYGSGVLLSLYFVFKVIDKEFLTRCFSFYFSLAGIVCTMQLLSYYLKNYFKGFEKTYIIDTELKFNLIYKIVPLKLKISKLDLITLLLSLPISVYYMFTRHWLLNNFYGILFSIYGI